MDKKIEILENTLLKLLVRRGTNTDRGNVVLSQGELGYTTDTKRLYVGDGATAGGIIVGNKYAGANATITALQNVRPGDYGYDVDTRVLYVLSGTNSTDINNWVQVATNQTAADGTIVVSNTNTLRVGQLSANNFSPAAFNSSLALDSAGRLTVNTTAITTNKINTTALSAFLELPGSIKINNLSYRWPSNVALEAGKYLKTDVTGALSWDNAIPNTSVFVASTAGQIPVGSIMPFVSASRIPEGWLICDGASVAGASYKELSSVIGNTYGGDNINFNLPNYINKTLYGIDSTSNSTLLHVSTAFNSSLSAAGVIYVIKHKSDNIVNSTITIADSLSTTLNNVGMANMPFSPLSGNIYIGLPSLITAQKVAGGAGFNIDANGRITSVDTVSSTPAEVVHKAGVITTINNTPIVNSSSNIGFLQTPVKIHEITTSTTSTAFSATLSAYPKITTTTAGHVTTYSIPVNAKSLILSTLIKQRIIKGSGDASQRLLAAAPNRSYLNSTNAVTLGNTEYLMGLSNITGALWPMADQYVTSTQQVFVPLSATSTGDLTFAIRGSAASNDTVVISIVGYTL